ncbi:MULTISPECIES: carbohydrate ABC transporter permease [Clostridium]|uniref:carbohydrate ABC transporter permease n=1 Tax=Clostridium TaxID=1485 RepID=UPI00069CE649|nr:MULTISPECIES: carbohydrate ABC transporter permease [Clostridium]KOF56959.1 lactose ABC transporter permease [Clostridium sp. DMHC 10]MCD2347763.1 carbohydrate ABC transporter permease [Clostridium guangxiense]
MKNGKRVLEYIFLILISIISIFPFLWMIISMTNKSIDVTKGSLIPGTYFIQNIHNLFSSDLNFALSIWNSAKIAIITTILALTVSSLAGYGFEIYRSKARDKVFNILLLSMMVPFAALMVPLFKMFSSFKIVGLNTMSSVIIPSISTAFLVFFFRQNTKAFPKDILEAGRIDGLNEFQIFTRIYVPVMKSTYAAGAIITFMSSWNNYMWPLIALQSPEKRTVPLIISTMGSSYTPDYGMIMAGIVIATLPTALVFFLMQKQFVAGMVGSVKG